MGKHVMLAVVPPLVAASVQGMFWPWLQPFVVVLLYPAPFLSSWFGGLRCGLVSTVIAAVLAWYVFVSPQFSFKAGEPRMMVSVAVFVCVGVLFSLLNEQLRKANQRLEERVAQRTAELEAARASVQQSEARMAGIVGSAMDAIISVDSRQNVLLFNAAAETMFGCPAAEALGQPLARFIPERFRAGHQRHMEGFGQTRHTARSMRSLGKLSGLRADGTEFPIEASISHVEVAGQKIYTVILRDITDRQLAEEALFASEAEFRASFYSAAVGKAQVDPETGRYLRVNAKLCKITGYSEEELLQKTFTELIHPDDRVADLAAQESLIRGEVPNISVEKRYVARNGLIVWVNVSTALVRDEQGRALRTHAIIQDITSRKEAEAALLQTETRFAKVFHSNPAPMCISTIEEGRFIEVNERCCHLFQLTSQELVGHTSLNLGLWDDWSSRAETMAQLQADGFIQDREVRLRRRNGDLLEVLLSVEMIDFPGEKEPVVISMFFDITARKQAEAKISRLNAELEQRVIERTAELETANAELRSSRAELKNLFESLPGLYLILTPDLRIVGASDAYLTATMTTREGIVGRDLFEVFPDNPDEPDATGASNLRASLERVLQHARPDIMAIQRYDVRRSDGLFEEHYWSPINSPLIGADQKIQYIIHRVEEVTEFVKNKMPGAGRGGDWNTRMQMEAEIFLSSQKVQAANLQLQAANRELESFSYSVSHDLRAPLREMDGFSRAVLEDCGPKLGDDGRRHLQIIRNNAQKMGALIDDLLVFSRLGRTPLSKQNISMDKLVQSALGELAGQHADREIDLRVHPLPACEGDPALLRQVWINLLSNAFKYSRRRELTVIEVGGEGAEDGIHYFVRDNGTGFDMRYASKLFGVFQRLHRAEDYEGTGVGLAIVQRVIHRHGGRVWADAVVDQGADFHFTLPAATSS